jgi:tetratricopeptide (TPR) repeat protein
MASTLTFGRRAFGLVLKSIFAVTFAARIAFSADSFDEKAWSTLFNAGLAAYNAGNYSAAIQQFGKARDEAKKLGRENTYLAQSFSELGRCYGMQKDDARSESNIRDAIAVHEKILSKDKTLLAIDYNNLGICLSAKGAFDLALDFHRKALAIDEAHYGEQHSSVAFDANNLAICYVQMDKPREALPYLSKAVKIWTAQKDPNLPSGLLNLGQVYSSLGDVKNACVAFHTAQDLTASSPPTDAMRVAVESAIAKNCPPKVQSH